MYSVTCCFIIPTLGQMVVKPLNTSSFTIPSSTTPIPLRRVGKTPRLCHLATVVHPQVALPDPSFMSSLLVSPFNLPPTLALRQAPFPLPLETATHPPLVLQDIVLQQPSFSFSPSPLCCRRHIRITLLLHRQHKRWSDVIAKRVSTAISLTSPDVAQIRCRTTSLRHAALAEAITSGNARVSPFCASSYFLSPAIVMKHMSIDHP